MWGEQAAKVLAAFPPLIGWVILGYVVWLVRDGLVSAIRNLSNLEVFGVKLSLSGGRALNAAIEVAQKHPNWRTEIPEADRKWALGRAEQERRLLDGAEILWVDDQPSNNRNEARMLRSFGALVTFACTTDEALGALDLAAQQNQPFHLILSDIIRQFPQSDEEAGLKMIPVLRNAKHFEPVVFYIGQPKEDAGVPTHAFGITHRPDQLLHLSLDALSRTRR